VRERILNPRVRAAGQASVLRPFVLWKQGFRRQILVSVTDHQPALQLPRPTPSRRLGLSGKLLLLTIPLVVIAGLMIYVPAIANFRMNRLNDRLAAANTAALVLDAAPLGMVPDSLARQILNSVGAPANPPSRWGSSAGCSPAPTCRLRSTMTSTCGR
jgi:hypothetical protein